MKLIIYCFSILVIIFNVLSEDSFSASQKYQYYVKELSAKTTCNLQCLEEIAKDAKDIQFLENNDKTLVKDIPKPNLMPIENVDPTMCFNFPTEFRFDCYPGGTNQTLCEGRGCCWDVSKRSKNQNIKATNSNKAYPREPPSCFYPKDYLGYQFVEKSNTTYGLSSTLERTTLSGYPNDVQTLRMDVYFESESRIRIRITDPAIQRWETPIPAVPSINVSATNTLYDFVTLDSKGEFAVLRKDNLLPIFDTRGAAPLTYADQFLQLSSILPSKYLYGLGQHLEGLLLDSYWHRRILWNYDHGPKPDVNLYGSHPFYIAMEQDGKAHGFFLLNSNALEIMIQPAPAITFKALGGILDFYLFLGPTPKDVIQQYTDVIGKPFLPPYWSLGYHQLRYNYFTLNRTKEVWQQTRDAQIPFDVQWTDIDALDKFRILTYDTVAFEGLPEFVEELHSVEMKYIPIVDAGLPYGLDPGEYPPVDEAIQEKVLVVDENGNTFVGNVWPGTSVWPDFTNPDTIPYWTRQLQTYHDLIGFDGAWLDMNEPINFDSNEDMCNTSNSLNRPPYTPPSDGGFLYIRTICMSALQSISNHYNAHNIYSTSHCIATNNALRAVRGKRPFIISRSSFAGLGAYAGHWTGDSESSFEQMYDSIADILNFNLFGIPMIGADICGFRLNTTVPLCVKWYLFGSFYPFARNHNDRYCIDQDPVSLGEPVITAARNSITERYRLLPYLYSLFFRAHLSGDPVARAMFYEFPEDQNTYSVDSIFMIGSGILIAPALGSENFDVTAYLPESLWYDWYSGLLRYNSTGAYYDMVAPEDVPNLLMKGGTIVTQQSPGATTVESRMGNFGLNIALDEGQTAKGELFWDDGDSLSTIADGAYNQFDFSATVDGLSSSQNIGYSSAMILDNVRVLGLRKEVINVEIDSIGPVNFDYANEILNIYGFELDMTNGVTIHW